MTPAALVVYEAWRPQPLSWVHRAEAHGIATELRRAGCAVARERFDPAADFAERAPILRLSDALMYDAAKLLSSRGIPYIGPGVDAMERCYDKHTATEVVARAGFACPETALGIEHVPFPAVVKPRRGSDSIGTRLYRHEPIPRRKRSDHYLVQRYVRGSEITVAVLRGQAGAALHVLIPDGALYSFVRKYVLRPRIVPLADRTLGERVRAEASKIAAALEVDWAARVDFIHEPRTDTLYFLECDVAPLVGVGSAFERSLTAAGFKRAQQLQELFAL